MPRAAYVEEVRDESAAAVAIIDAPPEAPSPPAVVNVFDFLVGDGATTVHGDDIDDEWESDQDGGDLHDTQMGEYNVQAYAVNGFSYGSEPVATTFDRFQSFSSLPQTGEVVTPAARKSSHSRNISIDSTGQKKSQKRKRAHLDDIDTSKTNDIVMTDVPAALHSGLTGGINRLLSRPEFPPSPDLSGDAVGESPLSPLKRNRRREDSHNREHRREKKPRRKSNSDTEDKKAKISSRSKESAASKRDPGRWERRRPRRRSASPPIAKPGATTRSGKPLKAIEYPSQNGSSQQSQALVKYENKMELERMPSVGKNIDLFLGCLVKGSETEQGVSIHKALKRWKRDGGSGEKDLWKGLKIRANDRGELIVCV